MFMKLIDIDDNTIEYYPLTSELIKEVVEVEIKNKIVICPIFYEEKIMKLFDYKNPHVASLVVTNNNESCIFVNAKDATIDNVSFSIKIISDISDIINNTILDVFKPYDVDCLSLPSTKNIPNVTSYIRDNLYQFICLRFKDNKSKAKFKLMI